MMVSSRKRIVALWFPRQPFRTILVFAGVYTAFLLTMLIPGAHVPLPAMALVAALGGVGAVMLARRWRRPFVALGIFFALAISRFSLQDALTGDARLGNWVWIPFVALIIFGTMRVPWGVRIACAAVGARLIYLDRTWASLWMWAATAAALLALGFLTSRRAAEVQPPESRPVLRIASAGAAVLVLAGLALPWFVPELPTPTDPLHAARVARLKETARSGGLLWPRISEAVT